MANSEPHTLPDIRQSQVLNVPIRKVWAAVSTSEGIGAWFMPNDFQPVVGHEFHLDAGPFGHSPCQVTEIDPPNRLSFNWGKDWSLTFELRELSAEKTEFTVIHGGWDADKRTEFGQAHTEVRETMSGGWAGLAQALAKYVEG